MTNYTIILLCTQHCYMVGCYHGGRDLGLRGSPETDHADHWVIAVNAKDYVVYSRGLSTPFWLLVLNT